MKVCRDSQGKKCTLSGGSCPPYKTVVYALLPMITGNRHYLLKKKVHPPHHQHPYLIHEAFSTPMEAEHQIKNCHIKEMQVLVLALTHLHTFVVAFQARLFVTPWTAACQASLSPGVCSNSGPLSRWCHPTVSSSVTPFSSCPLSFPASGSFPMSQLFTSGGQSTGALSSASVLPMNIQGWFPLGLTGLISLQSNELSRLSSPAQFKSISSWPSTFLIT